jgi:phthiocerol/phenolphthiocerol synthesis type-I polyketide synthase E
MKQFSCPNGLHVWNTPKAGDETTFIFREIFEDRIYEQHGIRLGDGNVILDVGANVGLYALSLMQRFRDLKIVCIEPVPVIRECLERNLSESNHRESNETIVLPNAIGAEKGEATIKFFPEAPANSTLHPEEKRRQWNNMADELTPALVGKYNKLYALVPPRIVGWFMKNMLNEAISFQCEVRTLSEIIREQGLQRVDLLKIDTEGAELEALKGLEEQHWPLIHQIAMEVEPGNKGELKILVERLRGHGFTKVTVADAHGGESILYAVRAGADEI